MSSLLPVVHDTSAYVVLGLIALAIVVVREYARHQRVKVALKKVKPSHRAGVIEALALLDDRPTRRWRRRDDQARSE